MIEAARITLRALYQRYYADIKMHVPTLLGEEYSNPYYSSIPDGWFETDKPRILIVGEEGFGIWGCGKGQENPIPADDFDRIQKLNYDYLRKQLQQDEGTLKESAFWRRFRALSPYGVCCWTNIDKIHKLASKNCALSQKERKKLHSIGTRVLCEEIEILNPTHIVFFGWYGVSLQHELPSMFEKMYPKGLGDNSVWNKNVVAFEEDGKCYIFAYHPNWGYRNRGYEDKVIAVLKEHLK